MVSMIDPFVVFNPQLKINPRQIESSFYKAKGNEYLDVIPKQAVIISNRIYIGGGIGS